jgi:hypothetical protein
MKFSQPATRDMPQMFFERDAKILEGNKIPDIIGELFVGWCAATLVIHTLILVMGIWCPALRKRVGHLCRNLLVYKARYT